MLSTMVFFHINQICTEILMIASSFLLILLMTPDSGCGETLLSVLVRIPQIYDLTFSAEFLRSDQFKKNVDNRQRS